MNGFRHQAGLYDGESELVAVAGRFISDALSADEPVLAIIGQDHHSVLKEHHDDLFGGSGHGRVAVCDAEIWYQRPAHAMFYCQEALRNSGKERLRILTVPGFPGPGDPLTHEWMRYEAALNVLLTDAPVTMLCLFGAETGESVRDLACLTHPELMDAEGPSASLGYLPAHLIDAECDHLGMSPRPHDAPSLQLTDLDMAPLRAFLTRHARRQGLDGSRLMRLLTVGTELATNALLHGAPPVNCAIWKAHSRIVCEVTDAGTWVDPVFPGLLPPPGLAGAGFGLWATRVLSPLLFVRTGSSGTTVQTAILI